jgi:acyl-CoA reductase-like NAD-dependent aldehyde dehydrogenase
MNISFLVDGAAMEAEGGATYERKDPMTGKVATRAAAATLADVNKVVAAASAAFETWSQTGPGLRRALLLKAADMMESRTHDLLTLML